MKKFIISLFAACAVLFGVQSAMAFDTTMLEGVYVTPKVGIGYVELDDIHANGSHSFSHGHDTAVVAGLTVGYDFSEKYNLPVRADLEYLYRGNAHVTKPDGSDFRDDAHALLVNASYDFVEVPYVTPYITAGLGSAWLTDGGTNFAYTFGGGVYYDVTENVAFDFSVRYMDYGSMNKHGYNVDESGANIMVGVRYTF